MHVSPHVLILPYSFAYAPKYTVSVIETINSCFWLANILMRKFDTELKKDMKMIKTHNCEHKFYDEKQQRKAKKV